MAKQIFINLAVKDLQKSMDFYTALGFTNNPQFSDDSGKCMVWSESIFVMILNHKKFASFATKPIADTKSNLAGLFSLSFDSLEEVNQVMTKGLNAGGIEPNEMKDYGFMQQRTIEDFDGHTWEVFLWTLLSFHHNHKLIYMNKEVQEYNQSLDEVKLCNKLATIIDIHLKNSENKIWHAHPVWFLEGNPIVGYSKQKKGIRLMFWSGADFEEINLHIRGDKFKDASIFYHSEEEINTSDIKRWLEKSEQIQWDYKNIVKRKGKLERLK